MSLRHFLSTQDWSREELDDLLVQAAAFKRERLGHELRGKSIALLFFMPWIDRGKVKSWRYRGVSYKIALGLFALAFIWLGKIGGGEGTWIGDTYIGRALTGVYFAFFIFLWAYTYFGWEKTKPVPLRVTTHD
jgi:ubiquinol-cytochrome c reductase cytochrome b subunit